MERLTAWDNGNAYYPKCFEKPCDGMGCNNEWCEFRYEKCKRLAEYEDTGLSPEEIKSLNSFDGSQSMKYLKLYQEEQRKHSWIPVSERLPDETELEAYGDEVTPVLITYLGYYDGEPNADALAIWCEDNTWRWYDDALHVNIMDVAKVEITAWMPLTEPYRPE